MTDLSVADADFGGKVDGSVGESTRTSTYSDPYVRDQREAMTAHTATAARVRTGGPKDDGPKIVEHVMGWTLVVVIAMLVTQLGLL
ncbi:SCO1431 family membrane protein [Streptomyces viridiviolaceus]